MSRVCAHPHSNLDTSLSAIPLTPIEPCQLLLLGTEVGDFPYCGIDNERGRVAAIRLTDRLVWAHLITSSTRIPDPHPTLNYADPQWELPHLAISGALAEFEGRLCVADWCRNRMLEVMAPPLANLS